MEDSRRSSVYLWLTQRPRRAGFPLSDHVAHGLCGVKMFASDAHDIIASALQEVFSEVAWQRYQTHFIRNITERTRKRYREGLRSELIHSGLRGT